MLSSLPARGSRCRSDPISWRECGYFQELYPRCHCQSASSAAAKQAFQLQFLLLLLMYYLRPCKNRMPNAHESIREARRKEEPLLLLLIPLLLRRKAPTALQQEFGLSIAPLILHGWQKAWNCIHDSGWTNPGVLQKELDEHNAKGRSHPFSQQLF